ERDIAERRRTEAELSASKELNERLIEILPGGVVQVTTEGNIFSANPEAQRILGLRFDEVTRRYTISFQRIIFEDGTLATEADYPAVKAITSGSPQPPVTLGMVKPNNEVVWSVFRAVPTKDPVTHEINGAVATFVDITERKHFEDKLRH